MRASVTGIEWQGPGKAPALHKEPLTFEYVHLAQRSYK
jgi:succinate dehydrogenase / fumarate reductase, flavoprotein subunit